MPLHEVTILIVLGLGAGSLGGLLGIGGSVLMIPVLTLLLGHDQHLSQAAAMIVNVFVALPAVVRHHRAGAIEWSVVRRMIPAGLAFILAGVALSNALSGIALSRVFGAFLLTYIVATNLLALRPRRSAPAAPRPPRATWRSAGGVGSIAGAAAGLLGIGGGVIAVPLLEWFCRLPVRRAIAASSAMMCVTSVFGATAKNLSLETTEALRESLLVAACLIPTAILGGLYGAGLTHRLPVKWVRGVLTVLLIVASLKLLGIA